jgi:D-alanyl-D-alanine carboxypeptidase
MATLAAALIRDFPDYYDYFKTRTFAYDGHKYRNHNKLLGRVSGVDGIKTGYTRASGYNLAASARRGSRHLIAVVMGGPSGRARDDHMTDLLNSQFAKAATGKTAVAQAITLPAVAPLPPMRPAADAPQQVATAAPEPAVAVKPRVLSADAPLLALPAEDQIAAVLEASPPGEGDDDSEDSAPSTGTTTIIAKTPAPQPQDAPRTTVIAPTSAPLPRVAPGPEVTDVIAERLRERWMIQIGAYDDEEAARDKLRDAQREAEILSSRLAYTEPVKSDATTLYRARFSGFDKAAAQAACNELRKANFPCLPMRQ